MDNDKLILIHPDGSMEHIGNAKDENEAHSVCLLDYAKEAFPEVEIFKKLNYRHSPATIAYFYTRLGEIVVLNITKNASKNGKTGYIMLPNEVTIEQVASLYSLEKTLSGYHIGISRNLKLDEIGQPHGTTIYTNDENTFKDILDEHFENINVKKSTL